MSRREIFFFRHSGERERKSVGFDNRRLSAVSGFHALYSGGFIIVVFVTYVKTHTHTNVSRMHSRFRAKYICMYVYRDDGVHDHSNV